MNRKHKATVRAIFDKPTRANIKFSDIEKLFISLGGVLHEGKGSAIRISFPEGTKYDQHRPHPGKEAKRYQVEDARKILEFLGVEPDE
ncbi:MAG: type II toxin-antitoxin system HicA family toxin [Acidobacteria bacterium]|nr:type II toxin-antitoxin system HicA family toxin [Acidobacteriota bacterium]